METPFHLGGHFNVTHLDIQNLHYLKKTYNIKTMLDIGCGPGGMLLEAKRIGIDAAGVDGDPSINNNNIITHDFTKGKLNLEKIYDLAWSCEFVEHVEEKYQENYMLLFQKAKIVVMTFAPPGIKGHHHVNCREEDYWVKTFQNYGLKLNRQETEFIRSNSSMNLDRPKKQFVKRNGLFFQNENI